MDVPTFRFCKASLAMSNHLLPVVLVVLLTQSSAGAGEDIGYDKMFEDSLEEVDWHCWSTPSLPTWLNGSFILPTVSQFSWGGLAFQGVLDGFGKLHRFQLSGGEICLRARFMRTQYYNQSRSTGTVPPAMLFEETNPRRTNCLLPSCNIRGANDNTYVNTIKIGSDYLTLTDSPVANTIDPYSLRVLAKHSWTDHIGKEKLDHVSALGSAHPLRRDGTGDWVALQIDVPMVDAIGGFVDIVTINDNAPRERKLLTTSSRQKHTPYMHSYGVTSDFVVLPYTPMAFSLLPGLENKPMEDSFSKNSPLASHFVAYPFNGSAPLVFAAPRPFTYNHLVNAYQNSSAIVFDVVSFQDASLYLTSGAAHIRVQVNKSARDALRDSSQRVWRYVLHLDGPLKGSVTDERISLPGRAVEFPKINMKYSTKAHCIYYGQEWFHNDLEFGSMAVLKHNMCKGTRQYWYRPSTFPSEASFIARPDAQTEDDGVLVFAVTHGINRTSSLVVVDGETMQTLIEQPLSLPITFATHGEWFDGVVGSLSPDSVSSSSVSHYAPQFV